ncbi:MAG: winged helix-turn-helix transcriptional regulator [Candidatus Omnitrophica bacterium]|nr:winged helix-turn-helix transcriptional regulator [Candidatus Omnitrophota bacterium]
MLSKDIPSTKRQQTAQSIASLLPYIVQGVHFGVVASRSMTQTQFILVVFLYVKGPCTMSTLASHLKVQMPTVTGLVDRLAAAKYIKRQPHLQDRRQIMIELTPKAHVFLKEFIGMYAKRWEEILLILDKKELEQMLSISLKLNSAMEGQPS